MSELSIRLLTLDDLVIFHALRLRACKEEPQSFLEDYDELAARPLERFKYHFTNKGWVAGAFIGETLVGITGLYVHMGKKLQHKGTVWGVYVAPEARGRSIGRKLIELLIEEAKKAGLELLMLSTNVRNEITVNLYQSLGFTPCGIEMHIIKLPDGYVDDVQMIRFLK